MYKSFKCIVVSILIGFVSVSLSSCTEETKDAINDIIQGNDDEENGNGLKEALRVGVDAAVTGLNVDGGYLNDQAVKLLLPPELSSKITALRSKSITKFGITLKGEDLYNGVDIKDPIFGTTLYSTKGLKSKEDELIIGLNRAAEQAAGKAKPIFVSAIKGMTLVDVNDILFGGSDTAATTFLKTNTFSNLESEFKPEIQSALDLVKVGDVSISKLYQDYTTEYNSIVNQEFDIGVTKFNIGESLNIESVGETDLATYSTQKGLNGLFLKVSDEEKNIRENPLARINDLLSKVFGQLDNK